MKRKYWVRYLRQFKVGNKIQRPVWTEWHPVMAINAYDAIDMDLKCIRFEVKTLAQERFRWNWNKKKKKFIRHPDNPEPYNVL